MTAETHLDMPLVVHRQMLGSLVQKRPCDHAAISSSSVQWEWLNSVHRQSGCFLVDRDRYLGANCGDSTGAVPGKVVRGLRVLAHRQGRRCARGGAYGGFWKNFLCILRDCEPGS